MAQVSGALYCRAEAQSAVVELQDMAAKSKTVTLLFAAKDNLRNNATVLQEFLRGGAAAE